MWFRWATRSFFLFFLLCAALHQAHQNVDASLQIIPLWLDNRIRIFYHVRYQVCRVLYVGKI